MTNRIFWPYHRIRDFFSDAGKVFKHRKHLNGEYEWGQYMPIIFCAPLISFCFGFLTYYVTNPMHLAMPLKIGFSIMILLVGTAINKFDDRTIFSGTSYGIQWCIMGPMIALLL